MPVPDMPSSMTPDQIAMDGANEEIAPEIGEYDTTELQREAAKAARDERLRLMPEYLEHYFLEDLPPIDQSDPFNQGIYMRFRINQMRQAKGKGPVE
jgi:hypothetical protein